MLKIPATIPVSERVSQTYFNLSYNETRHKKSYREECEIYLRRYQAFQKAGTVSCRWNG